MLLRDEKLVRERPPILLAGAITFVLVGLTLWLRVGAPRMLPIGYGIPIVLIALLRNRLLLWVSAGSFIVATLVNLLNYNKPGLPPQAINHAVASLLLIVDVLVVATVAHLWVSIQQHIRAQYSQLEAANAELNVREEEIARSNEELQSQTEELERQSEELRVTNEELASRERVLQTLLDLSRSLTTELSRGEMMTRICETLGQLIEGPHSGAAILQKHDDALVVECHHGFGPAGIVNDRISLDKSFAALVLARGRTAYIEDVSLRPDLEFPQPREGPPMASVLATPLRVRGAPVGTLEVFSRSKTVWTAQQVALAESLAAQTSVSLEAAELFEQVTRARHRFETVIRTMPVAVMIADVQCQEMSLNPVGAALFGAPVDSNVAPRLREWTLLRDGRPIPPEQIPIVRACRENIDLVGEELELITPDSRRATLLANARAIRNQEGELLGAVGAFVDITPQKELQRELDLRRREAEEASVRKTRFLAAVSHDIRTPANAISLLAELIRRTAANPSLVSEVPELAAELQGSAISLVNLLSDVLDVARFDSGKIELQESEFLLSGLIEEEHRQLLPLARQKQLNFTWSAPKQAIRVRADRIKLGRVLGNLVGNAIKFTEKGEVRVEVELPGEQGVQIRVIDTGIGIPPEYQRHIFDEFFQMRNPERDRSKGTGLGLTICHRLVEAMGGSMAVESEVGKGSTFIVRLPPAALIHVNGVGAT